MLSLFPGIDTDLQRYVSPSWRESLQIDPLFDEVEIDLSSGFPSSPDKPQFIRMDTIFWMTSDATQNRLDLFLLGKIDFMEEHLRQSIGLSNNDFVFQRNIDNKLAIEEIIVTRPELDLTLEIRFHKEAEEELLKAEGYRSHINIDTHFSPQSIDKFCSGLEIYQKILPQIYSYCYTLLDLQPVWKLEMNLEIPD